MVEHMNTQNPTFDTAEALPPSRTYWQMVWAQLKKNYWAMTGLGAVCLMMLMAIYAPFIAGRLPFVWTDSAGNTTYPFWRELFAPADSRETMIETVYNFTALFLPVLLISLKLFKGRTRLIVIALCATLLAIPFCTTQRRLQPADYKIDQLESRGEGIFPLIPYGPYQLRLFKPKQPPSWYDSQQKVRSSDTMEAFGYNLLGTDEVGRDVLVRVIYGARVSLAVGLIAVAISTLIGITIGSLAGYYGGIVDIIISRCIEIMICFPTFFLILTIIAMLVKVSIVSTMLVIGLTSWTGSARIMRGQVFKQRSLDYVSAARALGGSDLRIIFRHILPNAISPLLVSIAFGVASAIMTESSLSFLSLGVSAPTATWGELLLQGRQSPFINWWLILFPGVAIFIAMMGWNLLGEGLRDAMDPKLKK